MKKIKYLILLFTLSIFLLTSCEKNKNLRIPKVMETNSAVLIVTTSDPFINVADVNAYSISIDVDLLYDGKFNKIDIMIAKDSDYSKQYLLKSVTSVPASLTVSGADIIAKINELSNVGDVKEGDIFKIFTNIELTDGTYLPGILSDGKLTLSPANKNLVGILKDAVPEIRIAVPCAYNSALTVGSYHSVSTDWNSEGDITIVPHATNPFIVYVSGLETMEGLVETSPLEMVINPDYSVTVARQVIVEDLSSWNAAWTNMYYEGINGNYDTCTGTYTMTFKIGMSAGSWGNNGFVFTRN
jgi:hypothetical protein